MKPKNDFTIAFTPSINMFVDSWTTRMGGVELSYHVALKGKFAQDSYVGMIRVHLNEDRAWSPAWKE